MPDDGRMDKPGTGKLPVVDGPAAAALRIGGALVLTRVVEARAAGTPGIHRLNPGGKVVFTAERLVLEEDVRTDRDSGRTTAHRVLRPAGRAEIPFEDLRQVHR
jgi:hypothetical protein